MKEGQNCNYEKQVAYKSAKRPPVNKKRKKEKKKNREKRIRGESCKFWRKPIMLWWSYLGNQLLDHADVGICCAYYTPLLTYRRDWKKHNLFDRNHHRKFPRKQKGNAPVGQFGRRLISLSSTVGSCSLLDMWCA